MFTSALQVLSGIVLRWVGVCSVCYILYISDKLYDIINAFILAISILIVGFIK